MLELVQGHGEYVVLALLLVEWFLGNTKLVKANSSASLILGGLKKILELFKKPVEKK